MLSLAAHVFGSRSRRRISTFEITGGFSADRGRQLRCDIEGEETLLET